VTREVAPAPALRPAGKPEREPGRTERATTDSRHGAAAGPHGPTGRRQTATPNRRRPPAAAPDENEVQAMQTITKLRDKIERASVLKGWRMRWHMQ
jgi:hypothetical protein